MSDSAPNARNRTASVRVPCSTSNLGPGFDLLGLCLSLHLEVGASARPGSGEVRVTSAPADWPRTDDLLVRAIRRGLRGAPLDVEVEVASEIPVARGLGSSGAAVAAGLLLGAALATGADASDRSHLVGPAVELEGHPDNAVASLLGGCVLSVATERGWRTLRQPVHASIGFAAAWPRATLETARARAVLPASVPFAHAADQPRRLAALLEGLREGDAELVAHGTLDHLHVDARLPLVPGAREAFELALEAGAWSATLSGSGSAVIALGPRERAAEIARALGRGIESRQPLEDARELVLVEDAPRTVVS
ncbi:MAG: homoserine kinase [Planctomycetota bacterium]